MCRSFGYDGEGPSYSAKDSRIHNLECDKNKLLDFLQDCYATLTDGSHKCIIVEEIAKVLKEHGREPCRKHCKTETS